MKDYPTFSLGRTETFCLGLDKGLYDENTYWGRVKYNMIRCDFRWSIHRDSDRLEKSFWAKRLMMKLWQRSSLGSAARTSIATRSCGRHEISSSRWSILRPSRLSTRSVVCRASSLPTSPFRSVCC